MAFKDPEGLIESLLYDIAILNEQIVTLTADRDSYRTLTQVALGSLAKVTTERDRLQARNRELLAELREFTCADHGVAA